MKNHATKKKQKPKTQMQLVHDVLLTHEFMKKETIMDKTGIGATSISTVLTQLRRKGLVEGSGSRTRGIGMRWKKHPIDKPLYPPQGDLYKPRKKATPDSGNAVKEPVPLVPPAAGALAMIDALQRGLDALKKRVEVDHELAVTEAKREILTKLSE